jgi:hypothetical protein
MGRWQRGDMDIRALPNERWHGPRLQCMRLPTYLDLINASTRAVTDVIRFLAGFVFWDVCDAAGITSILRDGPFAEDGIDRMPGYASSGISLARWALDVADHMGWPWAYRLAATGDAGSRSAKRAWRAVAERSVVQVPVSQGQVLAVADASHQVYESLTAAFHAILHGGPLTGATMGSMVAGWPRTDRGYCPRSTVGPFRLAPDQSHWHTGRMRSRGTRRAGCASSCCRTSSVGPCSAAAHSRGVVAGIGYPADSNGTVRIIPRAVPKLIRVQCQPASGLCS